MQAAAHSLGMTFEVRYAQREPLKTLEIAREMVARPAGKRPENIVITDDYSVADRLLAIIDPAGVKTFLAYSSIPVDQRGGIGSPRGKYKGWLGSLEPQAEDAGYLTARALIERGKREKAFGPDGKLHMLAIAGDRSTPSSINRNQGQGLELRRPMFAEFTPLLADRYIERFSGGFDGVDFSRYSKVKNPKLRRYNFGFAQLLEPQS